MKPITAGHLELMAELIAAFDELKPEFPRLWSCSTADALHLDRLRRDFHRAKAAVMSGPDGDTAEDMLILGTVYLNEVRRVLQADGGGATAPVTH